MSNNKFLREELYRGAYLERDLSKDRIVICGAGALGSNLVDQLSRMACSKLRVIDFDVVETHNVSTQIFGTCDVGNLKVRALQSRVFRDVAIEIEAIDKRLEERTVKKFLRDASLVVDCFDNSTSRQLVQDHCRAHKFPCIHAGLSGDESYGEVTWDKGYQVPKDAPGDPCDQPMARNLITIVVAVLAEEIMDFMLGDPPRFKNWTFTLKDLSIRERN